MSKTIATFKSRSGSIKFIESGVIRYNGYGFLLACYSNFVPGTHFFETFDFRNAVTSSPKWPILCWVGR